MAFIKFLKGGCYQQVFMKMLRNQSSHPLLMTQDWGVEVKWGLTAGGYGVLFAVMKIF